MGAKAIRQGRADAVSEHALVPWEIRLEMTLQKARKQSRLYAFF